MHKYMCNMCGRSGSIVLQHKILGRVCSRCYNSEVINPLVTEENMEEVDIRQLALKDSLEKLILTYEFGILMLKAIDDSLSRYQMKLIKAIQNKQGLCISYIGKYKRSQVIIDIYNSLDSTVVCRVCGTEKGKPYITRVFKQEELK